MMKSEITYSLYKNASSDEKIEILFKTYYAALCKGVFRILKDEELTEDVVQEVFIKVWEKKEFLQLDEKFVFYLKRACYNGALNALKFTQKSHEPIEEVMTMAAHSDNSLLSKELGHAVEDAISKLPDKTRLVFMMSRYEEMTYKEIAEQLNVSVKAVEKHMGIALQRLKMMLKDHLYVLVILLIEKF